MTEQIQEVQAQGFKPIVFIENSLFRTLGTDHELTTISRSARKLNVLVYSENDIGKLNRIHKAYVFRYGAIPLDTETKLKRKGGKIVSGDLKLD